MRILFVSANYPRDPVRNVHGSFQRMRLFVDVLVEFADLEMLFFTPSDVDATEAGLKTETRKLRCFWGADVQLTLCPRAEPRDLPRGRGLLRRVCSFRHQFPYAATGELGQALAFRERANRADLVFAHRLNVMPAILAANVSPPIVLDMDDIDHIQRRRALMMPPITPRDLIEFTTLPALMAGEYRAIRRSRATLVCSERDRDILSRLVPGASIDVVENAVEVPPSVGRCPDASVVFVGSFNYGPNIEAARELIDDIWPRIRAKIPEARLRIAGKGSRERLTAPTASGVELLGFVDDLSPLYAQSGVMACPIRRGSGTRIKIIEAAARGVPVVSTAVGAEGLDFVAGRDIVLVDDAADIAAHCVRLLKDSSVADRMAENARRIARQTYSREAVQARIREIIGQVT